MLLVAICCCDANAQHTDNNKLRNIFKKRNKTELPQQTANAELKSDSTTTAPVAAETPTQNVTVEQSAYEPQLNRELSPEEIDSLLAEWNRDLNERAFDNFYKNFISVDNCEPEADIAAIPDSVFVQRLRALASPVQLPYNQVVKTSISRYLNTRYGLLNRILALSKYYFPIIEEELIKEGLPVELRIMPVIESALVPQAVSKRGAAGLWQFMPATGKSYGLEVNSLVDERCDPVTATRAACKYMRDLYNIYNDWILAIAAYNCGPGNVNKALARAGQNSKTFWDIYYYLPAETRGYVPAFIGASYACAYHKLHGIEVEPASLPVATDTITVNRIMHLEQVSSTIDVPLDMLRKLNPQYKLDIIPATNRPYALVLPLQFISRYVENESQIFAKDSTYLKEYINPANIDKKRLERPGYTYTVRSGDTLSGIANRNHVSVKELMRWNGLKNDRLRIGQKLRIEKAR